jgi:hypothetical protein
MVFDVVGIIPHFRLRGRLATSGTRYLVAAESLSPQPERACEFRHKHDLHDLIRGSGESI